MATAVLPPVSELPAARPPPPDMDLDFDHDDGQLDAAFSTIDERAIEVRDSSDPMSMLSFYRRLFPWKQLFSWLNQDLPHMAATKSFTHREFAFTLQNEAYLRYNSFSSAEELKKEVCRLNPARFEIGPVYTAKPKDRKTVQKASFKPVLRELVFDIDMTDYDEVRTCCSGKGICKRCWAFIAVAVEVLDQGLREDFGFEQLLWVYSGRRGIHCWISDRGACELADDARKAIVGWLEVVKGSANQIKKVDAGWVPNGATRSLHPSLRRAIGLENAEGGPLKRAFVDTVLRDQDCFRAQKHWEVLLQLLPQSETEAVEKLRGKWTRHSDRPSLEKWQDVMEAASRAGEYKSEKIWRPSLEDIILQYTYPRIDAEVSKHLNHLLKSPFVVHPATGRVCVPVDPAKVHDFDPETSCPTVAQLLRELNSYEARSASASSPDSTSGSPQNTASASAPTAQSSAAHHSNYKNKSQAELDALTNARQDWEKTSLKPFVEIITAMLSFEEAAADEDIFQADGFIRIPRSDGDPNYGPPNVALPDPSDAECNYYHIFSREEKRHEAWRAAIGEQLHAIFGLPPLSRTRTKWKLHDFPRDYTFTEQRKGPRNDYRTDPYLFGSYGHRFRSTKEAVEHLVWLIRDPDMNVANCRCKYCYKGPATAKAPAKRGPGRPLGSKNGTPSTTPVKKAGEGAKRKLVDPNMSAADAAAAGARKRAKNGDEANGNGAGSTPTKPDQVYANTSILVRGVDMRRLTPGVSVTSVPHREVELRRELKAGQCEGYRIGEVVWCELTKPLVDPTCDTRTLQSWPVVIRDPAIDIEVLPGHEQDKDKSTADAEPDRTNGHDNSSLDDTGSTSFSLNGRVQQRAAYQVVLLGTSEQAKVPETSLKPYLAGFIPPGVLECDLGPPELHSWLTTDIEAPNLNLMRSNADLPEPDFTRALVAFAHAVQTSAILRGWFNPTDAYSGADTAEGVLRDLGSGASFAAANTVQAVGGASAASGDAIGGTLIEQGLRYYQGLFLGTERIWVGDVVRLRFSPAEVKRLQRLLNTVIAGDKAPNEPDPPAALLDEDASYILRLGAIFEDPKQPKKPVALSGELYEIMTVTKYNALKKRLDEQIEKIQAGIDGGNADESVPVAIRDNEQASQQYLSALRALLPQPTVLTERPGLPSMPPLPPGFVMVSLSERLQARLPREVSVHISHVAGRVYPSLGRHSDGPRVEEQILRRPTDRKLIGDEDTQIELRARLSVAGLLSGCVKSMRCVKQAISRSATFKASLALARRQLIPVVMGELEEDEDHDGGIKEEDGDESVGGERAEGDTSQAHAGDASTTSLEPSNEAGLDVSTRKEPTLTRTETVRRSPSADAIAQAEKDAQESEAAATVPSKPVLQLSPDLVSEDNEGPLPPGWGAKKSRTHGSYFYVELATRKTQWNRPTE
ncbi:hypothetical protein BCV70DRAFT_237467 [Testicularia cyperi]|uniref:DNA primase n=1 Tax=Testicularia cyperi TaxID=1882483 RepID=A0A317XQY7_9BASI|nr:hypothetical protein BCV70DRAFT_237467 [Testicularia cyperi]